MGSAGPGMARAHGVGMIDKLDPAELEEGKEHPFTRALLAELRKRHALHGRALVSYTAGGEGGGRAIALGGRIDELRWVMEQITGAKGTEET